MAPTGIITPEMRRLVHEQRLGFVASVRSDGTPNVSPKGTTDVWDDHTLVFADLASPRTVANLRERPDVEVNVVDPLVRKGFRFRGTARVATEGPEFDQGVAFFERSGLDGGRERVRAVVYVNVTEAAPLVSPAYDRGGTEEEIRRKWREYYLARDGNLGNGQSGPMD
ncbi:MAG TPA: pyridoxamine 5'-phosphate oxidase family protein [Thermoplasmata archaeon]|nr:pyridoxamine 5'-phosphate oxidase family protein [Thermoplasmata archaeon]